jgi:DNA-binding NarL/FixJ family response regulator
MARRKKPPTDKPAPQSADSERISVGQEPRARILIVAGSRLVRARIAARLAEDPSIGECVQTDSARAAHTLASSARFDVAFIAASLEDGDGLDLLRDFVRTPGRPGAVLIAEEPTRELAVAALRLGALDLLAAKASPAEISAAARTALDRTRAVRQREARIERLTRVCRKLNDARHQVTDQVSSLCSDMVTAYQELSDQVTQVTVASEFNSLIRQELDVESVLRTALEYVLSQTGPTNAAVFLPGQSSDFSLGAYVNYDIPKDSLDMLLEHMASFVPRRMEAEHELCAVTGAPDLAAFFGDDAHWLGDVSALAFACHHEGECLAVGILFRDRRNPFPEPVVGTLRLVTQLFARQLARVIHVHHRHIPKNQWGGFEGGDDDIDLAA